MNSKNLLIKRKIWQKIDSFSRKRSWYLWIFKSYWNYRFFKNNKTSDTQNYITAIPNFYAGIGHQLANWNAGYWFSKQFELKYAHIPFSTKKWEEFLGFGENEMSFEELTRRMNYKTVRLPLFDETDAEKVLIIKGILNSYGSQNILFVLAQDQFYFEQFGVKEFIKNKFVNAASRQYDDLKYKSDNFNIAIHVRRTVIIDSKVIFEDEEVRKKRWLSNDYYERVLLRVLENLQSKKTIVIHIFSTAKADEFLEFSKYGEVVFCNDFNEYESFLHLVKADLLITSKSSFSYKPALISDGIKVCPENFWHGYPKDKDWILADNEGNFDVKLLKELV
tara:strand:- start:14535 stop:15539 length:1005 start_codon:yes stop_codon:yes gene_type:complete